MAALYKINYKSDFVLTINSDAGWAVPFCIKFWTGMPSQAYFVGFDGENYVNCRVGDTPTQLLVMFDDHHMPIGELKMQIAYHTTIEEFPDRKFEEVTNPINVTVDIDGTEYQVMLDFTGESGAEIDFSMPSSGVMSVNGKIGYVTLNAEDVGAQPTIEDLATIRSGAAEGATAYQKPGTGIPKTDLASGVQSSLDKADAAAPQANTYTKGEVNVLVEEAVSHQTMIVTISPDGNDGYVADKTFAEIKAFIDNGGTVIAKDEEDGDSYYYLDNYIASEVVFTRNIWGSGGFSTRYYTIDNTNTVSFIDSVHHISSAVDSSSTTNIATSAAVKTVNDKVATKQDTISDLATIRSGAAAGATAVQPATLQDGLATKQDVIDDLATIRSGAAAGATAVQPAGLTPIESDIDVIEGKIPSAASASNQLADKAFVNSALADKADTSDIPTALSQLSQDSTHRVVTDSEKSTWNGKQDTITDLSTIRSGAAAGATAVQPAALQEGLAGKQDTISDLATIRSGAAAGATAVQPAALQEGLAGKQDTISDLATIRSGAAAGATAVQPAAMNTALADKQDTINTVNVTVDNNTGTPSGTASVSGSTLSLSFQNLKGATGATGATGPQGPQGERGLPGESGVTGDVSGFTVIQTIDPSATYGATDIAGAATVQATNQELTELSGKLEAEYSKTSQIGVGRMGASSSNAGIGCVFNYVVPETMCLSAIALYTAYTGSAYFAIATIADDACQIEEMHEIELDGLYTDLFDLGIIVPAGKSVGLFGVTNSHSLGGSGYLKMGTPPTVGQSITLSTNVMNATILLSKRKSNSSIIEEMSDSLTFKNDIEVGDLSGTTNASNASYLYATKTTYDKDYWVTRLTLKAATTGYVSVFTGTPSQDGTTMTVESLVPIYFDGVDSVDLSDYKIFLKKGCCIGVQNCGKVISSSGNGYSASGGQPGTIMNTGSWIPSVKWTFSEEYTVKNKINNIDEEISDIEDSLIVESDEITIGLATGGSGFDGWGGIYKDQMDEDKYLTKVSMETAFTGTAYILVAEKTTETSCTIIGKYEVTLNGSTTDVSSYNIVVPKDHCVGMMGPSTLQLYSNSNSWCLNSMPSVGTVITRNNWAINASFTLVSKKNVGESVQLLSNQVSEFADSLEKMSTPSSITKSNLYDEDFTSSDGSAWVESASGIMSLSSNGLTFTSSGDSNYIQLARMYALNGREMAFKAVLYSDTILKFGQKLYNSSSPTFNCTINCQSGTITVSGVSANFTFVNGEEYMIRWIAGLQNTKLYVQSMKSGEHVVAQSSRSPYLDTYVFSLNSGTSPVIKSIRIDSCVANPYIIFMGDSITQGSTPALQYMYGSLIGEQLGKPYGVSGRGQGTINSIVGENSYVGRLYTEVEKLRPKYLVVMIGTNSGNTAGNLSALCTACEAMGVTLILNNIPCSNDGSTTKNDLIAEIRNTYGLEGMRMDLATSVNNDGATPNSSLYADTNLHPNAAGHYQMYLRSFVDTPDIYINAGVEPIAEEEG